MATTPRRLQIDLNRRTVDNLTPARYHGPTPRVGEPVLVFEPEDGVRADGRVMRVNNDRNLAYIEVDWSSVRDDNAVDTQLRALTSRGGSRGSSSSTGTWSEGARSTQNFYLMVAG